MKPPTPSRETVRADAQPPARGCEANLQRNSLPGSLFGVPLTWPPGPAPTHPAPPPGPTSGADNNGGPPATATPPWWGAVATDGSVPQWAPGPGGDGIVPAGVHAFPDPDGSDAETPPQDGQRLRDMADRLVMLCVRSEAVCAEILPRVAAEHFEPVAADDLALVVKVLKRIAAAPDFDRHLLNQPGFRGMLERAVEDACRPDSPERADLLYHPFFDLDGSGPEDRLAFYDWAFGQTPDGTALAEARGILKNLETAAIKHKVLERLGRSSGLDPSQDGEYLAGLVRRLAELDAGDDPDAKWWTPAEFAAAEFPLEWLVPNLLVKGQPCLLGGPSKALKTSLAVDLALSLGAGGGRKFLGQWAVPGPGVPVGFLSGESGQATIKETFARVAKHKGVCLAADNVHKCFRVPRLHSEAEMACLTAHIRRHNLRVVVLDPIYLGLLAGDASNVSAANLFQMGPLLLNVARACLRAGCTPILVHHTTKHLPQADAAGCFRPLDLENLAYAGFAEFARQWFLVNRRRGYQDGTGSHELWLRFGGSAGHGGLWAVNIAEGTLRADGTGRHWLPQVVAADKAEQAMQKERVKQKETKKQEQRYDDRKEVIAAMKSIMPRAETAKSIAELAGVPDTRSRRIGPILQELMTQGAVAMESLKKANGKTYDGYKLLFDPDDGLAHPTVKGSAAVEEDPAE